MGKQIPSQCYSPEGNSQILPKFVVIKYGQPINTTPVTSDENHKSSSNGSQWLNDVNQKHVTFSHVAPYNHALNLTNGVQRKHITWV